MEFNLTLLKQKLNNYLTKPIAVFIFSLLFFSVSVHYLGFNNSSVFLVWLLFFSCFHYFIYKVIKCPISLVPVFSISLIVIVLYISGIIGSLHYGYYFLIILGIAGLITMMINTKKRFLRELLDQHDYLLLYYFMAFICFIQSVLINKGFRGDDIHHWGIIMNGMCHYHTLSGFPRLNTFDGYTLGSTIWGYFINRLSGSTFKIPFAHWSTTICLMSCFIPCIDLFKKDKRISLVPVIFLLFSFIFMTLCVNDKNFLYTCSLFLILAILSVIIIGYIKDYVILDELLFLQSFGIFFLIYSSLLIAPNLVGSHYRSIKPEIALFSIPAACLMAYLAKPSLKTFFWILPILSIAYLYKRPGVYFSLAISVAILLHILIIKCIETRRLLSKGKYINKFILLLFTLIVAVIISVMLPSFIWGKYCQYKKIKLNTEKGITIEFIKNCFTNTTDKLFTVTRNKFKQRVFQENIFKIDIKKNGIFSSLYYIQKFQDNLLGTKLTDKSTARLNYIQVMVYLLIYQTFLFLLLRKTKYKFFIIISVTIILFSIIHLFGLLITYCYWFAGTHEQGVVPSYQRYASPMVKLFVVFTLSLHCIYISTTKSKFKYFLNSVVFIFSVFWAVSSDLNNHLYELKEHLRELSAISSFPSNLNFKNKKMLISGMSPYVGLKFAGPLFMNYSSCPLSPSSYVPFSRGARRLYDVKKFDYLLWIPEGETVSSNRISSDLLPLIPDISKLEKTCLFKVDKPQFKLLFCDDHTSTNILCPNNILDLNKWELLDLSENELRTNSTNISIDTENGKIRKLVFLKSNNYYRITFSVKGKFFRNVCGGIGDIIFKCSHQDYFEDINEYFYSKEDTNMFFEIYGSKSTATYRSLRIIDLGQKDRHKDYIIPINP